jgi:putative SOS response-associated peptidase YedK
MCGRFALKSQWKNIQKIFDIQKGFEFSPSYNVAPTHQHPVICMTPDSQRILLPMRWGLIPFYDKSLNPRKHFNARGESIKIKPTFRDAFLQQRCLVIADGFYEWKTEDKKKQPFYFQLASEEPFVLAGIWEKRIENGQPSEGFSLITTEANQVVSLIHDRMPVIIAKENYNLWLTSATEATVLQALLVPFVSEPMIAYAVTTKMSKPAFNNPECIALLNDENKKLL